MWNATRGSDGRPYVGDISRRKVEYLEEKVKKLREEVTNLKARNLGGPGQSR